MTPSAQTTGNIAVYGSAKIPGSAHVLNTGSTQENSTDSLTGLENGLLYPLLREPT